MERSSGRGSASLDARLGDEPSTFDFFQLVRLLDLCRRSEHEPRHLDPDPLLGQETHPNDEVVRFKAGISSSFPSAAVVESTSTDRSTASETEEARPRELVVNFMGLTGPSGVLPHHFTMQLITLHRENNRRLAAFQDVFNHRLVSLFYRAWEKHRFDVIYERCRRTRRSIAQDPFTRCVLSLTGHGFPGLSDRHGFRDEGLCYFAGHLAHHPRNAAALAAMLSEFLGARVVIEQFVGRWYAIAAEEQSSMAPAIGLRMRKSQLGIGLTAGSRVFLVDRCFRVVIGPLKLAAYLGLLPPTGGSTKKGERFQPVQDLIRGYCGPEFDIEFQLRLRPEEAPACRLGEASRLGWTTFMSSRPFEREVIGATFSCCDRV